MFFTLLNSALTKMVYRNEWYWAFNDEHLKCLVFLYMYSLVFYILPLNLKLAYISISHWHISFCHFRFIFVFLDQLNFLCNAAKKVQGYLCPGIFTHCLQCCLSRFLQPSQICASFVYFIEPQIWKADCCLRFVEYIDLLKILKRGIGYDENSKYKIMAWCHINIPFVNKIKYNYGLKTYTKMALIIYHS